ncbi:MAG TPA: hypothetical protein PK593_00175 [Thermomicrobiales bacterium]|jgi:hypothetical protein|nr:hypothetical protein [Thermomicrobiales bacterium]HQZ90457.1 hypothetical protein [Thermomicrobiales bacterium]
MSAEYTLVIHLVGGGRLHVRCIDHRIVDRGVDHHGVSIPPAIEITQTSDAGQKLVYLHYGAVAAIEIEDRRETDAAGN